MDFRKIAPYSHFNPRSRAFCACAHERRRRACIAEADNSGEGMERKSSRYLLLAVDDNIFAIECQIGVLGGDKQRVKQLFQSSIAPFR